MEQNSASLHHQGFGWQRSHRRHETESVPATSMNFDQQHHRYLDRSLVTFVESGVRGRSALGKRFEVPQALLESISHQSRNKRMPTIIALSLHTSSTADQQPNPFDPELRSVP